MATTFAGMSFVTTLPAPMTEFFPMVTPGRMMTPAPTQTFSSMRTGKLYWYTWRRRSGSTGWPAAVMVTLGPNITLSPMYTWVSSTSVKLKLA